MHIDNTVGTCMLAIDTQILTRLHLPLFRNWDMTWICRGAWIRICWSCWGLGDIGGWGLPAGWLKLTHICMQGCLSRIWQVHWKVSRVTATLPMILRADIVVMGNFWKYGFLFLIVDDWEALGVDRFLHGLIWESHRVRCWDYNSLVLIAADQWWLVFVISRFWCLWINCQRLGKIDNFFTDGSLASFLAFYTTNVGCVYSHFILHRWWIVRQNVMFVLQ